MNNLRFIFLTFLPIVFCYHDILHETSPKEFFPLLMERLNHYDFDLSKFGEDNESENKEEHRNLNANDIDRLSCDLDMEIKTAFQGTSDDKIIDNIKNITTSANCNRKGTIMKSAYFKSTSGTENGKFKFTLSVSKDYKYDNITMNVIKKKIKYCEFTLQKCAIDEIRKEFIHASFDDVEGPFAVKGLVKSQIGTHINTKDYLMAYTRDVLETVIIVGLNQQSRLLGQYARVLTFGGAKMHYETKYKDNMRSYIIESAESKIASIKGKN